jgi:hypothetical protein
MGQGVVEVLDKLELPYSGGRLGLGNF